jgi:hypothetical protein
VAHNLIIRGFDDKVHLQLGELANQRGVSINSIVKDAVDKWLKHQQSEVPRKHYLVIYSDDESMIGLLKSMDRLAKESDLFRCFCSSPESQSSELLSKLKWYDATIKPYYYAPADTIAAVNYQDKNDHSPNQQQQKQQTQLMKGELKDRVLTFELDIGFRFVKILPNYLDDVGSLNYASFIEWLNPNTIEVSS